MTAIYICHLRYNNKTSFRPRLRQKMRRFCPIFLSTQLSPRFYLHASETDHRCEIAAHFFIDLNGTAWRSYLACTFRVLHIFNQNSPDKAMKFITRSGATLFLLTPRSPRVRRLKKTRPSCTQIIFINARLTT